MAEFKNMTEPLILKLKGGGVLAYATYGSCDGSPVFHFHGHPGSRLEGRLADEAARRHKIRLIAIDRPGMGHSSYQPRRALLDWPAMVLELANFLNLEQFAVQGVSGGGPYALACAYQIPERLSACGVLAGLGPVYDLGVGDMMIANQVQFLVARWMPVLLRPLFWGLLGRKGRHADNPVVRRQLALRLSKNSPHLSDLTRAEAYVAETLEAFRQGSRGAAYDAKLFAHPWGFRLEDIHFQVHLWHGERDCHVPLRMGKSVAESLPNCKAIWIPGMDHLDVIFGKLEEVLLTMRSGGYSPKALVREVFDQ